MDHIQSSIFAGPTGLSSAFSRYRDEQKPLLFVQHFRALKEMCTPVSACISWSATTRLTHPSWSGFSWKQNLSQGLSVFWDQKMGERERRD